jgi:hypothetical protein
MLCALGRIVFDPGTQADGSAGVAPPAVRTVSNKPAVK